MDISDSKQRPLSKKEVRKLLQDNSWQYDEELQKRLLAIYTIPTKIYSHPDGRVMWVFDPVGGSKGLLHASQEAFEQRLRDMAEKLKHVTYHPLEGIFTQGEDFIEQVPQLIAAMAEKLRLKPEVLDGSVESLMKVDQAVKRYGKQKSRESPVFAGLIAYVGETMRRDVNGKWEMRLDDYSNKIWEPWIVDSDGRYCSPFLAVHRELFDTRGFSIYSATAVRINTRRPLSEARGNPLAYITLQQKPETED